MVEKLWGGRFEASLDKQTEEFGASIKFEQRLAPFDLKGSLAHVKMLGETGIITTEESKKIAEGLKKVEEKLLNGQIEFKMENEDIHMNMESYLHQEIGPLAGKLHTARSRNDQVVTDMHLYLKSILEAVLEALKVLRETIVKLAVNQIDTIMPGYTHLQHAQPISFGQHLMAYYQMLTRDFERFEFNVKHTDMNPLGAAALAGTTFPIDRMLTTKLLGFEKAYDNSMDAVSDRDFILEFLSNASLLMMHLSRFCEELLLWSSHEFKFVSLSDTYSTGSSIMPQKKNPDMAELIRGKTGRVYGNLTALLTVMKGLPLAYNKDFQEDKEGMFDSADTIITSLTVMNGMLSTLTVNRVNMEKSTEQDFSNATELADYLATKGLPFRKAHELVGLLVLDCIKKGIYLQDVNLQDYQMLSPLINEDVYEVLKSRTAVSRRNSLGGTGFESVKKQIEEAKKELQI
ncbi:argininosuccinate lyase [Lactococcus lactis subsp. lactis]|uniref:Argininosuccinate lyase n=3 Tax=Lactococcus lactis subsp. lactis TaxID=1360 RepID=ARLY_LACLA|nr:argininosuccinate lyase [Lactococcus lactis]Q9CJ76.1 RecName: Full=Argininosuccinate lyase; Short=ASAL; AltName: Full=Arginosuccinase [Lactococcus lactis subsp. lactis Il1403]MRM76468.1 argininosuccinate lyase [Lactococcus cremoris]AAK04223.1 argininosuccinate lyase [Lactococcus lactis subsp. lactis Il1403]ARD95028.1 argininosuccinate lyase [Lactococcus lactis subsp. lactis]ARE07257.1 argininosuccinate lyase [Lactococcus lactis subsp. lactis]ARR87849.1 argininosuccinate lyase [Lactococcus 